MITLESLENTETCFLQLWLMLENTRQELNGTYRRFCVRSILKSWFGQAATDDFIWEICTKSELLGLDEQPRPALDPRPHRELLRALVSVALGISTCKVNLRALDAAYSIAFPYSTPINVSKKLRPP
ncbi:MAG: hypothetical protein J6T44_07965 [Prevotella sp.]|nr:hypothetical protein [Prevotella sp.]